MPACLVQWPEWQCPAAGTVPFMVIADEARRDAKAITEDGGVGEGWSSAGWEGGGTWLR